MNRPAGIEIETAPLGAQEQEALRRQRALWRRNVVLWGLLAVLAGVIGWRVAADQLDLRRPLEFTPGGEVFAEKINPNTASWASLARLPEIGEKTAKAIVAYRENYQRTHDGAPAFTNPADLMRIKGIGPATVKQFQEYLIFE